MSWPFGFPLVPSWWAILWTILCAKFGGPVDCLKLMVYLFGHLVMKSVVQYVEYFVTKLVAPFVVHSSSLFVGPSFMKSVVHYVDFGGGQKLVPRNWWGPNIVSKKLVGAKNWFQEISEGQKLLPRN